MSTETSINTANQQSSDSISLPLYICGLAISIFGILAVNSDLENSPFSLMTITLTVIGYVFSFGCRLLQVRPRVVEVFVGCICACFLLMLFTHVISQDFFIPDNTSQGDLIMAIVLVWLTVARSWMLTSDEAVVFTAVTSIAMIGLVGSVNLNDDFLMYFFGYVICATFMLLHQTYLTQRAWSSSKEARSDRGVVSLQISLSLISAVIAVLVGMVLVVPVRAIGSHLSLANALKDLMSGQRNPDNIATPNGSTVNLSDDSTFNIGTGSGYSGSEDTLIQVEPTDHSPHYYIGRTYDTYQKSGWESSLQNLSPGPTPSFWLNNNQSVSHMNVYDLTSGTSDLADPSEPALSSLPHHSFEAHFKLVACVTNTLYMPYGAYKLHLPSGTEFYQTEDNAVTVGTREGNSFGYTTDVLDPEAAPADLRTAKSVSAHCPISIRHEYINQRGQQIVSREDQTALAAVAEEILRSLPKDRRTDFDKADAIREWVSQRCTYSLDVNPVPDGADAVSYFLFDSRKGYCDLFASSMAILCRYAGLPARVATGFDPGIMNGDSFDLRARDKHAWVQVWFNGYGWQTFDPTEGSVQDSSVSGNRFNFSLLLHLLTEIRLFFELNGLLPLAIVICIVFGLLYVYKIEIYDKHRKRDRLVGINHRSLSAAKKTSMSAAISYSKVSAVDRYFQFEQIMMRAGIIREPSNTPAEFLDRVTHVAGNAADSHEIVEAAAALTEDVMLAQYAPIDLVGETLLKREEAEVGSHALDTIRSRVADLRKSAKKPLLKGRG